MLKFGRKGQSRLKKKEAIGARLGSGEIRGEAAEVVVRVPKRGENRLTGVYEVTTSIRDGENIATGNGKGLSAP